MHVDKQLVADLANLNTRVGRYVLEHLDADTGRTPPSSPDADQDLGMQLVRAGLSVLERADEQRRAAISAAEQTTPQQRPV
ncbi:hypothetical protein [Actinophytocola oryzae]|uniref:hypothetical protein n=1 Tax=Actinophytocola oryzae TaxID=502181 RepID=UPI0010636908|nr:hypothetical protein [Actinophytocola oryzae]